MRYNLLWGKPKCVCIFLEKYLEPGSCKTSLHPHRPPGGKIYGNKNPANVRSQDEKAVDVYRAILFTGS